MTNLDFQPTRDLVLIKAPTLEEATPSGILKAPSQMEEEAKNLGNNYLEVVAIGPMVKGIIVGDRIMLTEGNYPQLELNEDDYILVPEYNIIGKNVSTSIKKEIKSNNSEFNG